MCLREKEREKESIKERRKGERERGGVEVGLYTSVCVQSKGRERVC